MYLFSVLTDTFGDVSFLSHSVNTNAFCAVIETNDYDLRLQNERIGIHELFAATCKSLADETTTIENIPLTFAKAIDKSLKESNKTPREGASSEANFAAVALAKNSVFVCTSGICRVHLIQSEAVVKVSRDHNFVSDLLQPPDLDRRLKLENDSIAFLVPTRTLGSVAIENKPPELVKWDVDGDYDILISSSQYHKFRDPSEYAVRFLRSDLLDLTRLEENNRGVVASIRSRMAG